MATLKETIELHKTKPWITDFKRVLIRPLRSVDKAWLGEKISFTQRRPGGETADWFVPTDAFWIVHANASHPVGKDDRHHCDSRIHTAFLTSTGSKAEFSYGYERKSDGVLVVEDADDFAAECRWWDAFFAKKSCHCGPGCRCAPSCPCRR